VSLKVEFIDNVSFSTHHIVIDIQSDWFIYRVNDNETHIRRKN
jgi:hypothetical protein